MSDEIKGKRIAFLAADGVERVELVTPWDAVKEAGGQPSLISLEGGSTWAEGLATRVAFELPYAMMQDLVDDVQTVSDEEMRQAMLDLLEQARVVAEGAGAASLALARKLAPELRGKRVGLVVSGGNVTRETVQRALSDDASW